MGIRKLLTAAAVAVTALACFACGDPTANNITPDGGPGDQPGLDAGTPTDGGLPDAGVEGCLPDSLPDLSNGSWDPQFTLNGFTRGDGLTAKAYDFTHDPDGKLIATGFFRYVDGERMLPLVVQQDNGWAPARTEWELTPRGAGFAAVAETQDGTLALATYDTFGARDGEIWLDTGSGLTAIGHYNGLVRKLVWFDGKLWVAGNFQLTEEMSAPGLAIWNGTSWEAPSGGAADGPVFELFVDGTHMMVGGDFNNIGGIAARAIAEWDGTTWTARNLDLAAGSVYALARDSAGELYAGGPMFNDPDTGLGGVAHWNGTNWELLGGGVSNGFYPGVVSSIANFNGKLYVGGCFKTLGAPETDPNALASFELGRWNGTEWESVSVGTDQVSNAWYHPPENCGDEGYDSLWDMEIQRLFVDGNRLIVGGSFGGFNGVPSQSVIAYDGENFQPLGSNGQGISGELRELAVGGPDCAVYGLGALSHAGGVKISGVAKFKDGWSSVTEGIDEGSTCEQITSNRHGDVFLGCHVFPAGEGPIVGSVYRLENDAWAKVGGDLPEGLVMGLSVDSQDNLWVVGGAAAGYVARLDGDAFTVLENGFDGPVTKVAVRQNADKDAPVEYAVIGYFMNVGELPVNRIAHWDGTAWKALGDAVNSSPVALEFGKDSIYVGTQFEGDDSRLTLGRWDGTKWEELATPENGLPKAQGESVHNFLELREIDGKLLAVGYVWPETGGRNVYLYDGDKFTAIGDGVNAIMVETMAVDRDGIWFGGSIADMGIGEARISSSGIAHYRFGTP